jgi:hypothetical protein
MALVCKGVCERHHSFGFTRGYAKVGEVKRTKKRCQICCKYLRTEDLRCPCCSVLLRLRGRNNQTRREHVNKYKRID